MASTPVLSDAGRSTPSSRRVGYAIAIVLNAGLLWAVHQLLDWGRPGFLTYRFRDVLPLISVSLVATIGVNAGLMVRDRGRFRAAGDLVTAALGLVASARLWAVFPVDFAGYDHDWSWLVRTLLLLAISGLAVATLVALVKLIRARP